MADKHSFDITAKVDLQVLDNAINQALREIKNRYDLKDTNTTIEFKPKESLVEFESASEYSLNAIKDILSDVKKSKNFKNKVSKFNTVKILQGSSDN